MKKWFCRLLGHKFQMDEESDDFLTGPKTCQTCGEHSPGLKWSKPTPMPNVKPNKK